MRFVIIGLGVEWEEIRGEGGKDGKVVRRGRDRESKGCYLFGSGFEFI